VCVCVCVCACICVRNQVIYRRVLLYVLLLVRSVFVSRRDVVLEIAIRHRSLCSMFDSRPLCSSDISSVSSTSTRLVNCTHLVYGDYSGTFIEAKACRPRLVLAWVTTREHRELALYL